MSRNNHHYNYNGSGNSIELIINGEKTFDQYTGLEMLSMCANLKNEFIIPFFSKMDVNGDTALTYSITTTVEYSNQSLSEVVVNKLKSTSHFHLLNIPNEHGETPLHSSAISNNKIFAKNLVDIKVDGSLKDHRNMTALDIALMMGHKEVVEILKKLNSSSMSDVVPSIYQWGQIFTSSLSLVSNAQPTSMLFNDELCAPIQTEFGQNFSLTLTDTGSVYSSGLCSYGKTGHKKKRDVLIPTLILDLGSRRIKSIACGTHHSLALDDLGCVWGWGNNSAGRLGLSETNFDVVSIPTQIPFESFKNEIVISIDAGMDNSFALCQNGFVFSWGNGLHGKLGYKPEFGFQPTPKRVEGIVAMKAIACSNWHTVFLDRKGFVYTCGSSIGGRLGRPSSSTISSHVPTIVQMDHKIKSVACGTNFTVVQAESGVLLSWGCNNHGQLGLENISRVSESIDTPRVIKCLTPYPIHSFAVGDQHVVCLSDQGEVYCFGDSSVLQCGAGEILQAEFNLTRIKMPQSSQGASVFKVSAGGSNTMISLSTEHQVFGEELLKNLNSTMFSDVRLTVANDMSNYVMAHKVVLAARCKKFDKLIRDQLKNKDEPKSIEYSMSKKITSKIFDGELYINVPIESMVILKLFLKYIYSDHTILTAANNLELGELAYNLQIERLSYLCNFHLSKSLENLPKSSLLEDFKCLKQLGFAKVYSDISFNCKSLVDESINGVVTSYKLFAFIGSMYFKTMLSGSFVEKDKKEIELFETSPSSVQSLLNYCYCEEIPDDINECIDMIIICDQHQMLRAKDILAAKVRTLIDEENICYIYHVSLLYTVKPLIVWCMAKFSTIYKKSNQLPYFDQLPLEIQKDLNEQDFKRDSSKNVTLLKK